MATGHSLMAPCGQGNSEEAGGAGHGAEDSPSLAGTALGGENGLRVGGLVFLGCAGGCQLKEHMWPCKQDRGWSPSSGQTGSHPTPFELKHPPVT